MREDRIVTAQQPQGAPNTTGSVSGDGPDPYRATQGENRIEIDLPLHLGKVPLTLNQRLGPYEKNRRTQIVRAAAAWKAKALKLGLREHISVGMHYTTGDNRGRDTDNLVPTLKAACDGLVDAGLVIDDLPKHMTKIMPTIHNGPGKRRLWLAVTVTDLSEESA